MNKYFIDCGAHCGESILAAKQRFGNDIVTISFEPIPGLAKQLQEIYKDNPTVNIQNSAVWVNNEIKKFINYIHDKELNFNIYYITDEIDNGGAIVRSTLKRNSSKKCIDEFNNVELKNHTEKMISAIEIMKNSKNVILDYQSNVSRFKKK